MMKIEDFQGDYGSISVSEKVFQRIWKDQAFDCEGLMTVEGGAMKIIFPGHWNPFEGPDFKDAEIEVDDVILRGDVEIHFDARDWVRHGHHQDPNFNHVILHVVYFPPRSSINVNTSLGIVPQTLVMMPLLEMDWELLLEEEDLRTLALEDGSNLIQIGKDPLGFLEDHARERWAYLLQRMRSSIDLWGVEHALHLRLLEALGFSRNRLPMLALGQEFPLELWQTPDCLLWFDQFRDAWRLNGLRPANHPLRRISQYADLVERSPHYRGLLEQVDGALDLGLSLMETSQARQDLGISGCRSQIASLCLANSIQGSRLDTLITNVIFPYLELHGKGPFFPLWYHWYSGDRPARVSSWVASVKKEWGLSYCNGLFQVALMLDRKRMLKR